MYVCNHKISFYIKTHDSELQRQEEVGHMRQTSELFTVNWLSSRGSNFMNFIVSSMSHENLYWTINI